MVMFVNALDVPARVLILHSALSTHKEG